jgi:hypothetical protein
MPSLAHLTFTGGLLALVYSIIVRRKKLRDSGELFFHIRSFLAGLAVAPALYLIASGYNPDLLLQVPGYQYYVAIGEIAALYLALYTLGVTTRN